jgi:hypothetical protein
MSNLGNTGKVNEQKINGLFLEFVREMDEHTTNGIVKKLDPVNIDPMVDHFISQCDHFIDKLELRDRIEVFLLAKFDYALAEESVQISEKLESSIQEKIKIILRKHFNNAGKFAGLLVNWAVIKPIKIFKTTFEPVIANTVLTYSLAVHPPYLDSAEVHYLNSIGTGLVKKHETVHNTTESARFNNELTAVKKYSEEDLANLTENKTITTASANEKKLRSSQKQTQTSSASLNVSEKNTEGSERVYVDIQRRLIDRSPIVPVAESNKISVNRYSGELRPIGDIQRVIAQNDHRIYSYFNLYKKNHDKKNGRISVKFQISPRGVVKEIKITHNSFNQELADRISLQLKTLRFSEIEGKSGEQTVYHTFYF